MFNMFKQMFTALTIFFVSLEKVAKASEHLSTWAEETAGAFADEARIQRQQKLNAMLKESKVTEKQLAVAK